jgi:hypothetical protein
LWSINRLCDIVSVDGGGGGGGGGGEGPPSPPPPPGVPQEHAVKKLIYE